MTVKDTEPTVSVLFHTTLIRDQNGLGFSIAGGEGSPSFKNNSDVSTCTIELILYYYFLIKINYYPLHFLGNFYLENNRWWSSSKRWQIIDWRQSNICKYFFIKSALYLYCTIKYI